MALKQSRHIPGVCGPFQKKIEKGALGFSLVPAAAFQGAFSFAEKGLSSHLAFVLAFLAMARELGLVALGHRHLKLMATVHGENVPKMRQKCSGENRASWCRPLQACAKAILSQSERE